MKISHLLLLCLLLVASTAKADALRDAKRLLRVTNISRQFESVVLQQTRDIVRSYSSIVSTMAKVSLPQRITRSIASCYIEMYTWEKFESGIAGILAGNLSQKELRLLIDFYSNRSLPPMEIQAFKDIIANAQQIQQLSADFIFENSSNCVERDAELIFTYLDSLPTLPTFNNRLATE